MIDNVTSFITSNRWRQQGRRRPRPEDHPEAAVPEQRGLEAGVVRGGGAVAGRVRAADGPRAGHRGAAVPAAAAAGGAVLRQPHQRRRHGPRHQVRLPRAPRRLG